VYVSNVSKYVAIILSGCCICCSGYTYIYMLQAYVLNVSPISDVCCNKCIMLQVFSLAGTGNERKWRRSRVHAQQHGVHRHANNSRHMRARAAGACEVLENIVLVAGVYDNGRLQLPCFGDHASLETGHPCLLPAQKL
jgi:hypothetical protein